MDAVRALEPVPRFKAQPRSAQATRSVRRRAAGGWPVSLASGDGLVRRGVELFDGTGGRIHGAQAAAVTLAAHVRRGGPMYESHAQPLLPRAAIPATGRAARTGGRRHHRRLVAGRNDRVPDARRHALDRCLAQRQHDPRRHGPGDAARHDRPASCSRPPTRCTAAWCWLPPRPSSSRRSCTDCCTSCTPRRAEAHDAIRLPRLRYGHCQWGPRPGRAATRPPGPRAARPHGPGGRRRAGRRMRRGAGEQAAHHA